MTISSVKKAILTLLCCIAESQKLCDAPETFVLTEPVFWEEMKRPTAGVCWRETQLFLPLCNRWQGQADGWGGNTQAHSPSHCSLPPHHVLTVSSFLSSSDPTSQPSRNEWVWIICKCMAYISINTLVSLALWYFFNYQRSLKKNLNS